MSKMSLALQPLRRPSFRNASRGARAIALPLLLLPMLAFAAVSGASSPQEDECYGFAFGRWVPALDLRAAGHHPERSSNHPTAPGGRDWAAAIATGRDTTLLLFPSWWPAGVHIHFAGGRRVAADTVRGTATALVADARVRPPRAEVLAWRIPCRAAVSPRP